MLIDIIYFMIDSLIILTRLHILMLDGNKDDKRQYHRSGKSKKSSFRHNRGDRSYDRSKTSKYRVENYDQALALHSPHFGLHTLVATTL